MRLLIFPSIAVFPKNVFIAKGNGGENPFVKRILSKNQTDVMGRGHTIKLNPGLIDNMLRLIFLVFLSNIELLLLQILYFSN